MTIWQPETGEQVTEIISSALAQERPLRICGHDTKSGLGSPVDTSDTLSLQALSGVIDYQPEELVLVVKAGTPLVDIEQLLAAQNQMLAFEPPHLDKFYQAEGTGTIGRHRSQPVRAAKCQLGQHVTFCLVFSAVSGRGDEFKSGSRVMKNVTGYDLSKLMCGSFGTLAVMTDITLKVLPRPETSSACLFSVTHSPQLRQLWQRPFAQILNRQAAPLPKLKLAGVLWSGWKGLMYQFATGCSLKVALSAHGEQTILDISGSEAFWRSWCDLSMIPAEAEQVYKLSVAPSCAPALLDDLLDAQDLHVALDWAGRPCLARRSG